MEIQLRTLRYCVAFALLTACSDSKQGVGENNGGGATAATVSIATAPAGTSSSAVSSGVAAVGVSSAIAITPAHATGAPRAECRRDVTLQAVTLGEPPPFDLVIVADHSGSLAWSKDELTAGLRSLLSNVKGRAVRVFMLTPTQYGASSAAARYMNTTADVVAWKDPITGVAYQNAVTNYVETCKDTSGNVITCPPSPDFTRRTQHGEWQFVMPEPIAVLTPSMSDAEFGAQQSAVADAVLAIGGTGSPDEQPLCTLSRYVSQPAANLPENVVMLVISDEDDVSKPEDCLLALDGDLHDIPHVTVNQTLCTTGCDAYTYHLTGTVYRTLHSYKCAAFSDTGIMTPGSEQPNAFVDGSSCTAGAASKPCSEDIKVRAQTYCSDIYNLKFTGCETSCMATPTLCSIELMQPMKTPCGPFTAGDMSFKDMAEYCQYQGSDWHDCVEQGVNREFIDNVSSETTNKLTNLTPGTTTADIGRYFTSKRATAFAAGKSLLEGILLDASFNCSLGPGQSYATNLESVIADPKHVFPLCQPYAPALNSVLEFAQTLLQTEYTLVLKADEHVTAVIVSAKDGGERALAQTDYTFTETTGLLSISKSALKASDAKLRVEVTSDCRPILN